MFSNIINFLFLGASFGIVFLFGVKFVSAGIQAWRENKKSNQRLVDTLYTISKKRTFNFSDNSSVEVIANGQLRRFFYYGRHKFLLMTNADNSLLSCTILNNQSKRSVIHFVYDKHSQTFLEKRISEFTIENEKKDIEKINAFINYIVQENWFPSEPKIEQEDKDYQLEKGPLSNINPLSTYKRNSSDPTLDLTDLLHIKRELEDSNIELKEEFLMLINTCFRLPEHIQNFDLQTQHYVYNIVVHDIKKTYEAHLQLLSDNNREFIHQVQTNLTMMQRVLVDILNNIHKKDVFDNKKILRIIQEKYTN